jgi:nicotinate dehydrogenase subunit A
VRLTVNGIVRSLQLADDTPLLYALRNDLRLVGTRFGCGDGQCGACMVLIDGRPATACNTPLWSLENKAVTTVEGLGENGALHPVQQALIDEQAAQCGYCMSGIAVSAAALLASNPDPSEAQVREALDRNLCRCGSHNRVVRAVLKAAAR